MLFVAFNSGGNDSVAMLQLMSIMGIPEKHRVVSLYTNTHWSAPWWPHRMKEVAAFCRKRGIEHVEISTKGFEQLVLDGDAGTIRFPNGMRKTCTEVLKIAPARAWLKENDPEKNAICTNGVRRAESPRRALAPIFEAVSINHGGRPLWKPLAEYSDAARNDLLLQAGVEILDHRSEECEICIHSNRADLRRASDFLIDRVRRLEESVGRVMFRPKGYAGATGIDEVMRWAYSDRGKFKPASPLPSATDEEEKIEGCEDDFCGL